MSRFSKGDRVMITRHVQTYYRTAAPGNIGTVTNVGDDGTTTVALDRFNDPADKQIIDPRNARKIQPNEDPKNWK
ncbi:hypothetical protein [Kitasatospora terrestris]|uniref:Hypervirulence associated protein TUDOR domain-containing protein n=1 Tax=Kitasatospora terrestris TaxID=258051 RepID=A0ABP9DPL5_9ACTN